mgnify:CR=1 FL=1
MRSPPTLPYKRTVSIQLASNFYAPATLLSSSVVRVQARGPLFSFPNLYPALGYWAALTKSLLREGRKCYLHQEQLEYLREAGREIQSSADHPVCCSPEM